MGARRGAAPAAAWPVARARALGSLGPGPGPRHGRRHGRRAAGQAAPASLPCSACWRCWRWPAPSSSSACCRAILRVSERVAEAEIVKTVADGLETALEIVDGQGSVLYRNRRPAAPHRAGAPAGTRRWRSCSPASPAPRKPSSASTAPPSAASRARRRFRVRSRIAEAGADRWLRVAVRPFPAPGRPGRPPDALAGHGRDARAHAARSRP